MKVGAILPHLGVYGGVRRFLELGNVFTKKGIEYTIFCNKEQECRWFSCNFKIKDWSNIETDYILIGDPPCFRILPKAKGKIFIYVIAGGLYIDMYKAVYGKYPFILINRASIKYFPRSYLVEGGINTKHFTPKKRRVLYYNDPRTIKGSGYIESQLKDLKNIELVGLKGLNNEELANAYKTGDYFVAWEAREGGTCNTGAEALASGLTVVTNGVNCEYFLDRVIVVENLRKFFADPMGEFSWERAVDKLLKIFQK